MKILKNSFELIFLHYNNLYYLKNENMKSFRIFVVCLKFKQRTKETLFTMKKKNIEIKYILFKKDNFKFFCSLV